VLFDSFYDKRQTIRTFLNKMTAKRRVYSARNCNIKVALNLAQCSDQTNMGLAQNTTMAWKKALFITRGVSGRADDETACQIN
jgi:hypothetical protein